MHVRPFICLGLIAGLTHLPPVCLRALEQPGDPAEAKSDWAHGVKLPEGEKPIDLFNGKDLEGWEGQEGRWSVEGGMIRGANTGRVPSSTYLHTKASHREFRLLFEVKQTRSTEHSTMHSAVSVCGEKITDGGDAFGFRGPLLMFCNDWGIWDAHRRNRVHPAGHGGTWNPEGIERTGDWNRIEVLVRGNRIRLAANGKLVFDFTDQPGMLRSSPMGLQLHANDRPQEYRFRGLVLVKEPTDQLLTAASESAEDKAAATRRYLYLSTPDGAQSEGRSGAGILVFDIDAGHKLVRRIEVPIFQEGLRGFTGSAATHCVYFSSTSRRLGCFDLEQERVVWERTYPAGCDRSSITRDGKKIYVPTGWWYSGEDSGLLVINAENGELLKRIQVGLNAHNSITSLDGRYVYLGTTTMLSVFDTTTDELVRQVKEVGERGVFPFTVDSANRIAYVCLGGHVGFDVVDMQAGKVLGRVLAGKEPIAHRTHGAGLTPDGSELWISDQDGKKLFIFDATKNPPGPKGDVDLSQGGHGWVCFSLDGRYAWCHTPDVFDVKTKQLAATLKDEKGNPVSSSKFIEVHFRGGKVVEMGNEFGLERVARAGAR